MADTPIAHSAGPDGVPQSLAAHAANVAARAAGFAAPFGAEAPAAWLGWWHDAGKIAPEVQAYLRQAPEKGRGPDHSSVGMLEAFARQSLLAFNVAGHHGGLMNHQDLKTRKERAERGEERTTRHIQPALETARTWMTAHAPPLSPALPNFTRPHDAECWIRMLHSALVDADCLDTEQHFDPDKAALRSAATLEGLFERLEAAQAPMPRDGAVNEARRTVYTACLHKASCQPGFFSLTVPTGGGKTRSSMAFALRHAQIHGHRRVIVVLPYTSIIEQSADVYRGLFEDADADSSEPKKVLEHHSAQADAGKPGDESEAERRGRLAAENWEAPVIVTTQVQFFESLFANRNGRLRKLHRIAQSVVILDEVQTLPPELLVPTLDMLRTLVARFGVTVLLCTATQPALKQRDGFGGLPDVRELIDNPAALFQILRRVRYEVPAEPWTCEDAAAALQTSPQALAILNTKKDAVELLTAVGSGEAVFHLSTRLCGAHRREVLAHVRTRLRENRPVKLVSTQVVEAGVDVDFPLVLRAQGPLDRIIQAAGRCNREGRLPEGRVIVYQPVDGGMPPGGYRVAAGITDTLLRENPALDFDDPAVPLEYFRKLYERRNLDQSGIQKLRAAYDFEEVAAKYRLIQEDTMPVVVNYEGGHQRLDNLLRKKASDRVLFRALQPYVVQLFKNEHQQAVAEGLCHEVLPGLWRWDGVYDALFGLRTQLPLYDDLVC